MPLRPDQRRRYPPDWAKLSARIRFERAESRCECTGDCGHDHDGGRCPALHGQPHPVTGSRVVLTVAHLDHMPENCVETNLLALCQRCHLAYDAPLHAVNASHTRAERAAAGMDPLFEVEEAT